MDNSFEIKNGYNGAIIEKNGISFSVEKGPDGDIWFNSTKNIELSISFNSRNDEEWRSYVIFENLMKAIVGKYILDGDDKDQYSLLPKDFIDLEEKTITWHSDSDLSNTLQLKFGKKEIVISIYKEKNISDRVSNNSVRVRIRTSGSNYGYYYQEFEKFYRELSSFAHQVESLKTKNISTNEMKQPTQKRLSLFNKFKK